MTKLSQKEQKVQQTLERFNREVYDKGNLDAVDELLTEGFRHHAPFPTPQGRDGFKEFQAMFHRAFPDGRSTIEETLIHGDKAAVRYKMEATHKGEFMDIPATGKRITVQGMSIYRFEDGRVAEEWTQPDLMGMMQQLGVVSAPGEGLK